MLRILAVTTLAFLLTACTGGPQDPSYVRGPGPGPDQYLLKEACALKEPPRTSGGEAPMWGYSFKVQVSPTERLNRSTSIAGDGRPWLMTSVHLPNDGCPAGDVLAVLIDDTKIKIRFEYAGVVNISPLGQPPKYKPKRITIQDQLQVQRGLQVTRETAGGTYTLIMD
ncbi:hypothetical protein [Niveispirillum fermenti]|uniref:hypothetical protein n=1 Tax=Niveispirillum fermenti TaxID=1233113 RepID=UPI003A8A121D